MTTRSFGDMSKSDIAASYSGTFFQVKTRDDDGYYTAKLIDVFFDYDREVRLRLVKMNGDEVIVRRENRVVKYNLNWPTLGMTNVRDHVVLVQRVAQRQWKKGLRASSLSTHVFDSDLLHMLEVYGKVENNGSSWKTSDIGKLYDVEYTDFHEALESVGGGDKVARAISPDFCVTNKYECNKPVLHYKTHAVGVVEGTTVKVSAEVSHVLPLLKRIVPNGYHNSIIIQP